MIGKAAAKDARVEVSFQVKKIAFAPNLKFTLQGFTINGRLVGDGEPAICESHSRLRLQSSGGKIVNHGSCSFQIAGNKPEKHDPSSESTLAIAQNGLVCPIASHAKVGDV